MARRRCITILLAALAAACGDERASVGVEPAARDSAGVRIVENGPIQPGLWHVDASPLFVLGWGPEDPTFAWVQSGRILPDGSTLASDFSTGTVYRIEADGTVVATWGRKGDGPGEYQGLDALLWHRDSVVVSDGRLRRVTLLSLEGEVLSTRPLAGSFFHKVSSILDDGRLLLVPGDGYSGVGATRPEWVFETQPILAASATTSSVDTLAILPHLRRWYGTRGASPGPVLIKGRAGGSRDGFAWSRSDVPEVRWYDPDGHLKQVARWDEPPRPLTDDFENEMRQIFEGLLSSQNAPARVVESQLAELDAGMERHDGPLPYWDEFHVDREGNAWLREYSLPTRPSERWRVISRDGSLVGWVELPDVIAVLDISRDHVLAVRFNELEVPAITLMRLLKE